MPFILYLSILFQLIRALFLSILFIPLITPTANASKLIDENIIQKLLIDEANRQQVSPALALAIAEVESNFNAYALSSAGAMGVMQIMPATAENVFGVPSNQLYNPKINIRVGITFIKQLLSRYDQRLDIALSHYNGGSAVQDNFGRLSVIPATKHYVKKVLSAQEKFKYRAYALSSGSSQPIVAKAPLLTKEQEHLLSNVTHKNQVHSPIALKLIGASTAHTDQATIGTAAYVKGQGKPAKIYSNEKSELALYEKIEQLRTLRLHNIMRNTPQGYSRSNGESNTASNTERNTESKTITKNENRVFQSRRNIAQPMSPKRVKILSWEKVFN